MKRSMQVYNVRTYDLIHYYNTIDKLIIFRAERAYLYTLVS
jgi:hypothetical protein